MKIKNTLLVSLLIFAVNSSNASEVKGLAGDWCYIGMSLEKDGEISPEKYDYHFFKDDKHNYSMRIYKQAEKIEDMGNEITTKPMGNYRVIEIAKDKMVLLYGSYMHYLKGKCK